jgi:hypothetical protein
MGGAEKTDKTCNIRVIRGWFFLKCAYPPQLLADSGKPALFEFGQATYYLLAYCPLLTA